MSLTLVEIAQQEEALQLNHFNHDVAWQLGCALKQMAESQQAAVAIEVYGFGQTLFQYAMPGTCADHLDWLRRKRNSVLRYGRSSYYLSLYNAQSSASLKLSRTLMPQNIALMAARFRFVLPVLDWWGGDGFWSAFFARSQFGHAGTCSGDG